MFSGSRRASSCETAAGEEELLDDCVVYRENSPPRHFHTTFPKLRFASERRTRAQTKR